MKELVEYIVKSLVENPDKVKVSTEEESEKVTILNIEVDSNDLGKVIGKGGKIANSIRTIVKSASLEDTSPISNLLSLERFPPQPNTVTRRFG